MVVVGVATIGIALWRNIPTRHGANDPATAPDGFVVEEQSPAAEDAFVPEELGNSPISAAVGFSPQSVIGNVNCRLLAGRGVAGDSAVVVLPTEDGARFEVLNGEGRVFGGSLPFAPHHLRLGKRPDGSVLAGFGDLRLNSRQFRGHETSEPVHIYMDGQLIYESDKTLDFDIAADGSSFFAHEPMAGNASRLIIRNLDLGREDHYDLGVNLSPVNEFASDFSPRYSEGGLEVMFVPAYADAFGRGPHYFFPADGGNARQLQVGERGHDLISSDGTPEVMVPAQSSSSAVLASSESGYFADLLQDSARGFRTGAGAKTPGADIYRITRREFRHAAQNVESVDDWSREIALMKFDGRMSLSDSGDWLAVHAWNLQVLDTSTGETVFEYPVVGDKQAELARLSNVMEPGATVADVDGISGVRFLDDQLMIFRRFGSLSACSGDTAQYNQCVASLRQGGMYRSVVDVFDMSAAELHGQPDFRVDYSPHSPCESGEFALRGLQVHGEALTFLTTRR